LIAASTGMHCSAPRMSPLRVRRVTTEDRIRITLAPRTDPEIGPFQRPPFRKCIGIKGLRFLRPVRWGDIFVPRGVLTHTHSDHIDNIDQLDHSTLLLVSPQEHIHSARGGRFLAMFSKGGRVMKASFMWQQGVYGRQTSPCRVAVS
jgi:hypothetical protein